MQQSEQNPKLLSPLTLAYIGDAVFELMVRERIVRAGNAPVNQLHHLAVRRVCAAAQHEAAMMLLPTLSDEEAAIYRRGRNAHSHPPKNADPAAYRSATGLEALFGYLYLKGEQERISALFAQIWDSMPPVKK